MRLLKPSWLHHDGNPIFSIDIHPDDTRIVTGGQGNDSVGRVVIWNMQPILSKEEDSSVPKLLCQLDHHNACVNCVRWSNCGKFLCSGGDDRVIIIWKLVSKYSGNLNSSSSTIQNSAFGKTNLEQWKTSSMLRSHTGDILHLAWSPGDRYLASASVDNTVIVWDAQNFPQLVTVIKGHESLVKGITWDPIGKYLASQSDDKTLRVWRVSDWEQVQCVREPFVECGGTTHVLRLDWSPDGLYLVSAHAMNGGGPTAQIVERTEWKVDKDFVGHRKAVVCVKFNGNILQGNGRQKHCCVALGSRDRSVSIWSTALKRPLVVIKDLFTNSVMDISWSSCGTIMMACSWDGSVAVAQFSRSEIGKPLTLEEKANFFHKLYGKSVATTESCEIIQNLEVFLAKNNVSENISSTLLKPAEVSDTQSPNKSSPQQLIKGPTDKQIETRTADGRRRITPKFLIAPTDGEEVPAPQSEQAIFMQVKCKEDVVANNQTTGQDWRKNMVSGIENVKGFGETTCNTMNKNNADSGEKMEENVILANGSLEKVKSGGRKGEDPDLDADKSLPKLVNGNGVKHVSLTGESGDDSRTKTDDGSAGCGSKEELMNKGSDEDKNNIEAMEVDVENEVSDTRAINGSLNDEKSVSGNKPVVKENRAQSGTNETEETTPAAIAISNNSESTIVPSSGAKKDGSGPSTVPAAASTGAVNMIAVRKKNKLVSEEPVKPFKKVKIITTGVSSNVSKPSGETEISKVAGVQGNVASNALSGVSLAPPPRAAPTGTSPLRSESSPKVHNRLPPIKAETVFNQQINVNADCSYSLQVTNHFKRPDGLCHQIVCVHEAHSLHGLEWTLCTDAPICAATGDGFRVVVVCENATAHVLDVKGRYAFPPIILSGQPCKILLHGPYFVVVTARAFVHVWNVHTKSVVLKSESLLPLLNHTETERDRVLDISRIQVAAGGLPLIVLNTGRTFMYSGDLNTWFLLSDPRGLVSSPLMLNSHDQSLSSRMILFSSDGRMRSKPEPAIVSHIKLKLATCIEMKNPEGVKQWIIALAKSFATQGLEKELRQLCDDLLGPTHSSAKFTSKWAPKLVGVLDKRELLRQILTLLLEDLKYQDLYCEFDEMLREVESHSEMDGGTVS